MSEKKPVVIRIFVDGDSVCALIGDNLQEGEAEFEKLPSGTPHDSWRDESIEAADKAIARLKDRLNLNGADDCVLEFE